MSLSKDEWRDMTRRRYGLVLINLSKCCNGYGAKFNIDHGLVCKKRGITVG